MSTFAEVTWQPPSALPLFGEMVGGILDEVLECQATLEEGYGRLLSFDAPTFLRIANVYREHDYWIRVWTEQFLRWKGAKFSAAERALLGQLEGELKAAHPVVKAVMARTRDLVVAYIEDTGRDDVGLLEGALALGRFELLEGWTPDNV